MEYIWSEKDIVAGRYVCHARENQDDEVTDWMVKWTNKIGFLANGEYAIISMSDGMISPMSKSDIVIFLNSNKLMPMPHKWLLETVKYLQGAYEIY